MMINQCSIFSSQYASTSSNELSSRLSASKTPHNSLFSLNKGTIISERDRESHAIWPGKDSTSGTIIVFF